LRRSLKSPIFDGAERAAPPIACVGGGHPVSRLGSSSLGRPSSWLVSIPEGHQNLDPPVNWSNVRSDAIWCYQSGNAMQVDQVRSHRGGTRRHPTGSSTRSESHPTNGALHRSRSLTSTTCCARNKIRVTSCRVATSRPAIRSGAQAANPGPHPSSRA
jgi:hypothetical protein